MRCEVCGKVFGGESGFDRHRVGDFEKGHMGRRKGHKAYIVDSPNTRRCLTDKELEARGLSLDSRGVWVRKYVGSLAA
jgi:hypothetical protein